jgi:hypothetical protein
MHASFGNVAEPDWAAGVAAVVCGEIGVDGWGTVLIRFVERLGCIRARWLPLKKPAGKCIHIARVVVKRHQWCNFKHLLSND